MTLRSACLAVALFALPALALPALAQPAPKPAAPALTFAEGFATPESVLFDAESDTYLVSNINGAPLTRDNNGSIMELSPDGTVLMPRFIEGGKKGVTLNAPKGMAVAGGLLYVADIDTVRLFDRRTGAPRGEVKVLGASFVNDLSAGPDGKIYLSDSGLKVGKDGFEPTGTDGLYVIVPGKKPQLKTLLKSKDLHKPNGVLATSDTLYVVTFGANELLAFDLTGKKKGEAVTLPKGSLDGVVAVGDELLISSWEGKAVYRGKAAGPFVEFRGELEAPADIGFDVKRSRLLVPHFTGTTVEVFEVK